MNFREVRMKYHLTLAASCVFCALGAVAAQADCAADLARMTGAAGAEEGISKDGSLAPLQGADTGTAATPAETTPAETTPAEATQTGDAAAGATEGAAEGIAKDGTHTPLEDPGGQDQAGIAMSGQDAQAQQQGEATAADQAAAGATPSGGADRDALIESARTALAAGDEEACLKALEQAAAL